MISTGQAWLRTPCATTERTYDAAMTSGHGAIRKYRSVSKKQAGCAGLNRWADRAYEPLSGASLFVTPQGCLNEIDQALLPERLVEKSNGARLKRHRLRFFVGQRCDEYNWRAIAFS